MQKSLAILTLLVTVLLGCSDDDSIPKSLTSGPPEWVAGFPNVAAGAITADFNLSTDRSSKVFYIVTDRPLDLTAYDVVEKSKQPDTTAIKFNGTIDIASSTEVRATITSLFQNSVYYGYFVAQNIGDSLYLDTPQIHQFETSYRQDTLSYYSAVEQRQVMYLFYRPETAIKYPDAAYPVCYFLGGDAEMATDDKPVNLIRDGTLPEYINTGHDVPVMVISIQHANTWTSSFIHEAITYGNANHPVDQHHLYVTGISEGATACWEYAKAHPDVPAAIVPISGSPNIENACNLSHIATWAFHNETDYVYTSSYTTSMINAINDCSPDAEINSLLFPDPGHNCWRRVYNPDHEDWSKSPSVEKFNLFDWLLTKSR